ncbi:MAG: S-layer homology domain-containing protein, partial [Clostridia bacterium]|nr:S-layer homology domain-containing protein [Clostridia bacterium]
MKRILTLLLVFVMVMQISVFCVSAAEVNVTYKGMDYSAGTPSQKSESDGRVMTRPANPLGWKVTLPYKTSALKLTYSTGEKENGVLNVRLGSSTGEIIGSIETDILAPTWATYTHVISLSKSLVGNQDIWITISKGSVGPGGGHWIDSLTFLKDSNAQPFATLEIADAYKDIKDDPNVHEINMLTELGVFSDSDISFMPDKPMKRAEFACGLGKLLDAQKYATEVSPFKDVKEGTDEADILSGLYQAGIIKGDTDGNFRPTSYITPLEASIVCLNALGYEGFAKDQNTVLDLANTLKLFDGIKLTNKVTKSQGAKLIYNLLLADYLAVNEMSDKEIFYNPTKNYLENSTDYIHAKGVVTANAYTKLYAPKKSEGISIDGISYKLGDGVNGSYLGVRCEFFYHEEDGEKVIDVIRPLPKVKWNYVESTTDIDFTKISEKKVEYTIISEDEEYEYELDKNTAIIYNGVALTKSLGLLISDPADFEGSITMIDNDSDNILDAIWIDHVSRVIEIGFVSNGRIKDELATNPQYSIYDTNLKDFVVFKGGRPALPDELASGTVLTLYESSESGKEQFVRAIADENIVTGTITSFSNGKYTIDGKEYRVSSLCNDDLYVGQTGKFVLDRYDFIIACEEEANSEFMSGLYLASDGGEATALEKEANIKLLTKAGIEIFTVAQKVIVDGVTIKTVKDFNERVNPTA